MRVAHAGFVLDDQLDRFDFATCRRWLAGSYWSPGISRREVEFGFRNSALVVGSYAASAQIGCLRVASDHTRFAYVLDVFVDPAFQRRGLGQRMVRFAMEHPALSLVFHWMLGTQDAHGVYAKLGFVSLPQPERYLVLRRERAWLAES